MVAQFGVSMWGVVSLHVNAISSASVYRFAAVVLAQALRAFWLNRFAALVLAQHLLAFAFLLVLLLFEFAE